MKISKVLRGTKNKTKYNKYYKLYKKYGDVEFTPELLVIENIKRILDGKNPTSDSELTFSCYTQDSLSLEQFLRNLREVCNNHSIYTAMSLQKIFALKTSEIDSLENKIGLVFPDWLKTVLNRQKLMVFNAKLNNDSPYIFCFTLDRGGNYKLINQQHRFDKVYKDYKYRFGLSPSEHARVLYFGLNGVMIENLRTPNAPIYRHRLYINHLVVVKNHKLEDLCDGICVGEIEPGVFIVLTHDFRFVIVPIYNMGMYNEPVYPGRFDKFEKILTTFFDYEEFDRQKMKYWSDLPPFYFNKEKYKLWKQSIL
jgi:hypothetical protein